MEPKMFIPVMVITLIIVAPILFFILVRIRNERKFKARLASIEKENNVVISEYDRWKYSIIALCKNECKLIFIKETPSGELKKTIDLNAIQKCRTINTNRSVSMNGGNNVLVIDRLELALTYKNTNNTEEKLEFYKTGPGTLSLENELTLINKWQEIINREI